MRRAIALVLLSGCAGAPVYPGSNNCGMYVRQGGWLTPEALQMAVNAALDAATFTTDVHLGDTLENCQAMTGFVVVPRSETSWKDPAGRLDDSGQVQMVSGITWCVTKIVEVGDDSGNGWARTSLVHELFHVMQRCYATRPVDHGQSVDHANWHRDGINTAIIYANTKGQP